MTCPALFLDRDGIINCPPPPEERYLTRPEDFVLVPGIVEIIRLANERSWPVVVFTNQKCVAIGKLSLDGLAEIHAKMLQLLAAEGVELLAIKFCPHDETAGCACRKPKPGMLLEAAAEHDLALHTSWAVGDQIRDCQAAHDAGCRSILVQSEKPAWNALDCYAQDLYAAYRILASVM